MPKKDSHKDSTTDFFLKFITRQKEEKQEDKPSFTSNKTEESLGATEKAYTFFMKAINFINTTLDKMLSSKTLVKLFSLALTVILVFVINGGSMNSILSSPSSGDFLTEVPVKVVGLTEEYEISGIPDSVNVMMAGSSLDIYTVKASKNYEVYLDVTALGEGEHAVEFKTRNFPKELKVAVQPASAVIRLSAKTTSTFKLGYRFINSDKMDSAYSVSVKQMAHEQVEVRGSQDTINKIYSVEANIDLTGVDDSFSQEASIYAYDRSGAKLDVKIIPDKVNVDCVVTSYSKEVSIVPVYKGQIEEGFAIAKATLSKDKAVIYGEEEALKNIDAVYVDVDISGLNQSLTINNLSITKVKGVNKISVEKVNIDLEIDTLIKKTISDIPIIVNNNTNNYTITYKDNQSMATIEVAGAKNIIDKLTLNDIKASIDIKDLSIGSHTVTVTVKINNENITFTLMSPTEIVVGLQK